MHFLRIWISWWSIYILCSLSLLLCFYVWFIGIFQQEMHSCGFVLLFWISAFYDKYRWHSRAFHCWRSPSLILCWLAGSFRFFYVSDNMVENSSVEGHTPSGRLGQNWHLVAGSMCSPLLNTEVTQYRRHNNKFTMNSPATMKMFAARKRSDFSRVYVPSFLQQQKQQQQQQQQQ